MSARSPASKFAFGDGARVAGRHDGFISGAHSEDEDGDFELESFPLTSLALGPWHARHVSLRLYFPSGRFVFVVVRRRRAAKATAFSRTAELVTRHVARRLHVDVPMSPFDPDARGGPRRTSKRACGDRGPNGGGGFSRRSAVPSPTLAAPFETFEPGATASVATERFATERVAFAEGSRETASSRNHTTRRRSKHERRCRDHVMTYTVDHDDVVGLNYVNPLCADGRLAMEARRVVKRAHATLDDALASFATDAAQNTRGVLLNASNATPTVTLGDVFDRRRGDRGSRAAGVGRAGARRFPGKKNAPGSPKARKRSRLDADARVSENTSGNTSENTFEVSGVLAETSDAPSPRTPPRDDEAVARGFAPDAAERESRASLDVSPDATPTKSHTSPHRCDDTDDTCGTNGAFCDQTVFRDQTVFLCFDDPRLPAALRDVVTAERRLLALAEDGIPVWALVMASCGLYYRPWLRTAARLAFVALALWSAAAGARDVFRFCAYVFAKNKTGADGVETSSPAVSAVSSASANTLFLGSLAWTGGARLGLVDARAVRALTAALGAGARALARVFAFVGYVVGRIAAHRLSLAISIRRAWRGLPGMWADAHGFVVASETDAFRRDRETTEKASGGDFRAETFASPRRRKPETPARGAPTVARMTTNASE